MSEGLVEKLRGLWCVSDSVREIMNEAAARIVALEKEVAAMTRALEARRKALPIEAADSFADGFAAGREAAAKVADEWYAKMLRAGELPADQQRMVKAVAAHVAAAIRALPDEAGER